MPDETPLRFPTDRFYAPEQDMWVAPEDGGVMRIGATHWVAAHGQFMYFSPRPVGTLVDRDRSIGVMETAKTLVAIHSPVSGRIVESNEAIVKDVSLIERDPYGEGWMFRIEPTRFDAERSSLLDANDYARWLAPRIGAKLRERPIAGFDDGLVVDPNRGY